MNSNITLNVVMEEDPKLRNISFKQPDIDLFNSKAGVEKIHRQFDRCAHKFNFTVMMPSNRIAYGRTPEQRDEIMAKYGIDVRNPDVVNVVFTNNVTGPQNYRPMNAWTLAHRIGHALQASISECRTDDLWTAVGDVLDDLTGVPMSCYAQSMGRLPDINDMLRIMPLLMTMRSARHIEVSNILDVQCELIAQYLITGSVKFLPVEQWDERKAMVLSKPDADCFIRYVSYRPQLYAQRERGEPKEAYLTHEGERSFAILDGARKRFSDEEINEMLRVLENVTNNEMFKLFDGAKGQLLGF